MNDRILSAMDVALRFKVQPETVRRWVKDGLLKPDVELGRAFGFRAATIAAFVPPQEERARAMRRARDEREQRRSEILSRVNGGARDG